MYPQNKNLLLEKNIQSSFRLFLAGLIVAFVATMLPPAFADHVPHNIAAGNLKVDQIPGYVGDENLNLSMTLTLSVNDFRVGSSNRADYNVQIGTSTADDTTGGILISAISQNVRTNYGTNLFHTPTWVTSGTAYRLTPYGFAGAGTTSALEDNVNMAAAWFPYSTWLGGYARNSGGTNGGYLDAFTGSPGLVLQTHFMDYVTNAFVSDASSNGVTYVDLTSLGIDSRTDGILLVSHAKEEGNFAFSQVNSNNGTWRVMTKDNRDDAGGAEQDPVAFVFIPRTNTTVVSGHFLTDNAGTPTIDMFSGDSPQFTLTKIVNGSWFLKMTNPNHTPTNGVLIVSGEGNGAFNLDNIVSYEPTNIVALGGDGWALQSRDLPAAGLQNPHLADLTAEPCMGFVYIPANLPGITVTPTNNLLTTEAGGTAAFTVVLDRPPYADVNINVSSSNSAEGTNDLATLTFTTGNWSTPQTVTVTGVDDALFDGAIPYTIILAAATSVDSRYNGINADDVSVVNADNEPGFTLNKSSVTTTEAGGGDSFTIVLNTVPAGDVTIGLSSSDTTEGDVSPASVTFTPGDWNIAQPVTVTGVNDDVDDGDMAYSIITAPATSTDGNYNGFNGADISAVNVDNDTTGYTFGTTATVISEGGAATNISLVLNSEPTANVTVNFSSGDTTEGTVTASLTFTPGNWSTPQNFTITPVDDFINDGAIAYTIITTSSSSADPLYAAANPADIATTTADNEAQLTLPSGDAIYGIGDPGVGLDGRATLTDSDSADFDTGSLTATVTANGNAGDRLEVRNTGNGAGEIGVSGSTVSYGGTPIGTLAGGIGLTPLMITLNSAATPTATEALLRSVTYRTTNNWPVKETRTVSVALADGDGGTSTVAGKTVQVSMLHVYNFQQGLDYGYGTYLSAADVQIRPGVNSGNTYPTGYGSLNTVMFLDEAGTDDPEVLLRFTNIVGNVLGQIPTNAVIVSAELVLNCTDTGGGGNFFRMLVPWNPDAETWDSLAAVGNGSGGVQADDQDARSTYEAFWGPLVAGANSGLGAMVLGVMPDMQAWANGAANEGWMIKNWNLTPNGTAFSPCETANPLNRPRLRVSWLPPGTQSATFRQGVNDYTNAFDTRIRQNEPTTDRSAITVLYVDWAVTGSTPENDEQILMRFDQIFGNATNQIRAGAVIHAAALDLVGIIDAAPGDGGKIHAMLQPWSDTNTWDVFVNGVQADGVEAGVNYTTSVGNPSLNPQVQATVNTLLLTPDVQAWANGTPNYGWVMLPWPNGADGWGFASAEGSPAEIRPQLRVYYLAVVIQSVERTASDATITFTGPTPGSVCTVYRSGTVNGSYTGIGTATVQPGGVGTFTDTTPLYGAAFYRVSFP